MVIAHHTALFLLGSYTKIMIDSTLFIYQLFCLFFIFLWVIPFFEKQHRYQTYEFFLPKIPAKKFYNQATLAFFITLLAFCLLFYAASIITLWYLTKNWYFYLIWAYINIMLENAILMSAAIFFSLAATRQLAYLATLSFYLLCYTSHDLYNVVHKKSGAIKVLGVVLYRLLPDLTLLDIKSDILYGLAINTTKFFLSCAYALSFSLLFWYAGKLFFAKILYCNATAEQ